MTKSLKQPESLEDIRARWKKEDKRQNDRLAESESLADAQAQADLFFDYEEGEVY